MATALVKHFDSNKHPDLSDSLPFFFFSNTTYERPFASASKISFFYSKT